MPGLTTSLLNAMNALLAQQGALNATTNNIANVNTPGYSRQVPIFEEGIPATESGFLSGSGVVLKGFRSVRDQLLELRIQQQTQQQSGAQAQSTALQQIEPLFGDTGQDLGSQMAAFFSSISRLSEDPGDLSLRQGVLAAAQNLVNSFHLTANGITQVQRGLNNEVVQDVQQINEITSHIANLNQQLGALGSTGQAAGAIQDQINELTRQLSEITDIQVSQSDTGTVLTAANGIPLVVGQRSYDLQTTMVAGGMQHVLSPDGQDLTSVFTEGHLGGTLHVRDVVLPGLLSQIDTLANQFATAFNAAQAMGYDLNGDTGQDLFSVPATAPGSASAIDLATNDVNMIAASADGTTGSNGNLANLLAVQSSKLPVGTTPTQVYANLVFQVGSLISNAKSQSDALDQSLQQLTDQRSATSGVSLDEETTNLIRYQRAYEASAKVISTVNDLMQVVMNII